MSQTERPQEADHPVDENSDTLDPDHPAGPYPSGKNARTGGRSQRIEATAAVVWERVALLDRLKDAPEKEATGWPM